MKNSVFKLKKLEDHKWANLSHYNYLMRFTHFVNDDEHTEPIFLEFFREINYTNFFREIDFIFCILDIFAPALCMYNIG